MSALIPRIPIIDGAFGFDRYWYGNNPSATHAFNALSFLFPDGERFFIEVAREVDRASPTSDARLRADLDAFVIQEAAHARLHAAYNAVLGEQGYAYVAEAFVRAQQRRARRYASPLTRLAAVCAYEHYTAMLGDHLLTSRGFMDPAPPAMALLWGWHAAEETEHKAVCFDLYRAAGGGYARRVVVFLGVTLEFAVLFTWLYFSMLARDGCLRPRRLARTLADAIRFFFGGQRLALRLFRGWIAYLSPRFHPWRRDNRGELEQWLRSHRDELVVRSGA